MASYPTPRHSCKYRWLQARDLDQRCLQNRPFSRRVRIVLLGADDKTLISKELHLKSVACESRGFYQPLDV